MSYAPDHESGRFISLVKHLAGADGGPADGRSQSVAARMLGVSAAYVGRIVRDEIQRVRESTIVSAASELSLPMTFFRADDDVAKWRAWVREPVRMPPTVPLSSLVPIVSAANRLAMLVREGRRVDPEDYRGLARLVLDSELVQRARAVEAATDDALEGPGLLLVAASLRASPSSVVD